MFGVEFTIYYTMRYPNLSYTPQSWVGWVEFEPSKLVLFDKNGIFDLFKKNYWLSKYTVISIYICSTTVVLYFYMNEISVRKFSKKFWWILICKYYYDTLRKHWPPSGSYANMKLIHFPINNQDPLNILNIFQLKVHLKKLYMKNTSRLLDSLNNNYGNFCQTKWQFLNKIMHFQNVIIYFIFFN